MKRKMSFVMALILVVIVVLAGCNEAQPAPAEVPTPSAETIASASGQFYYEESSYTKEELIEYMQAYPYPASVTIATVNEDGSPNISIVIPGISEDGNYFVFGLADNRTAENFIERELAVVAFYEYNPTAEDRADRNRGCRVIIKYPGAEVNEQLNEGRERPALFMEIVEILPIG